VGTNAEYQPPQSLLEPAFPLLLRFHAITQQLSPAALLFGKLLTVHFLGPKIVFVIQERCSFLPFCLPIFAADLLQLTFRSVPLIRPGFLEFTLRSITLQLIFFVLSKQLQRLRP
jgi:hypothetical protein